MTLMGYTSRNMPTPELYAETIDRRVEAKHAGDKATANALKLVLNTTYGAMLNSYNDLYDPLMGRSVCISGQLFLLELAKHLEADVSSLRIIQLNTDGIMISFEESEYDTVLAITQEWQDRTGFELEEDKIKHIIQRDVNNYVEVPTEGDPKIKGGELVRGIAPAGAFKINNNMTIVAKAVAECLANGTPVEETIRSCNDLLAFQLIAKAGSKYSGAYLQIWDFDTGEYTMEPAQNVNRVYATNDFHYGTLFKKHKITGNFAKIPNLPLNCMVDNDNHLTIDIVDKDWYIRLAQRKVREFLGQKKSKRNTRKINALKKSIIELLED